MFSTELTRSYSTTNSCDETLEEFNGENMTKSN